MAITVVVIVEGGIVQEVASTEESVSVRVVDLDEHGDDPVVENFFASDANVDEEAFVAAAISRYLA